MPAGFPGSDPDALTPAETAGRALAVLDACPDWLDDSALTYELAEEILLREGDAAPDPRRDAGAYRFLFEHRLNGRLETYRRMLLWMSGFWRVGRRRRTRPLRPWNWPRSSPTPSTSSPATRSRSR